MMALDLEAHDVLWFKSLRMLAISIGVWLAGSLKPPKG